ncbi:MAG TPA: MBL fold metallo-hydrolase, partial [Actinomycetaceae bacterium]|nr:MBL fold metallo-hydrolase [Actinomycetaceae bacterium]
DAVFISHFHSDHVHDLLPIGKMLMSAMTSFDPATGEVGFAQGRRIPLIVPAGAAETLERFAALFPVTTQPWLDQPFSLAFDIVEHDPAYDLEIGGVRISLTELRHVATNHAIRLDDGRHSLVYSGDTGPTPALADFARDADALLVENTLIDSDRSEHGHLSTAEAARAAAEAGVGRLILTHYLNTPTYPSEWRAQEAAAHYDGPIDLAAPDAVYDIPARLESATAASSSTLSEV